MEPEPKPEGALVLPLVREWLLSHVGLAADEMTARLPAREAKGLRRYGQPLHVDDGRGEGDIHDEVADALCYCARQVARDGHVSDEVVRAVRLLGAYVETHARMG